MDVILLPFYGKHDQPSKHIFKWEVINVTKNEMAIQVNFSDPTVISPRIYEEDEIQIIFKEGGLLRSVGGERVLANDYKLVSAIPR
jgi:hypothetical protein